MRRGRSGVSKGLGAPTWPAHPRLSCFHSSPLALNVSRKLFQHDYPELHLSPLKQTPCHRLANNIQCQFFFFISFLEGKGVDITDNHLFGDKVHIHWLFTVPPFVSWALLPWPHFLESSKTRGNSGKVCNFCQLLDTTESNSCQVWQCSKEIIVSVLNAILRCLLTNSEIMQHIYI